MHRSLLPLLFLPLPLVAADAPAHRGDGDRALAARRVLLKYCAECHGGDKGKGGGRLSVLDHRKLVGNAGPRAFASTDKAARSQVVEFLEDGSMPPGGRPRPTADEVRAVREWAEAGAKEYSAKLDDAAVLGLVAADLAEQPEKGAVRYVSLAHLAESDPAKVAAAEAAVAEAFAPFAGKEPVFGHLLDPLPASANTVYRLNAGKLRWDADNVFNHWENGRPKRDVAAVVPFDLIHLENPHPPAVDAKAAEAVVRKMNPHRDKHPLGQLRAVPFVRADWLAGALRRDGKPTPLADELLALADLDRALLRGDKDAPGPTPRSPFAGGESGPGESVWAWYRPAVPLKNPPIKLKAVLETPVSGAIPDGGGGRATPGGGGHGRGAHAGGGAARREGVGTRPGEAGERREAGGRGGRGAGGPEQGRQAGGGAAEGVRPPRRVLPAGGHRRAAQKPAGGGGQSARPRPG